MVKFDIIDNINDTLEKYGLLSKIICPLCWEESFATSIGISNICVERTYWCGHCKSNINIAKFPKEKENE